jgi:uncharacterized phosphosugar-binding protein
VRNSRDSEDINLRPFDFAINAQASGTNAMTIQSLKLSANTKSQETVNKDYVEHLQEER